MTSRCWLSVFAVALFAGCQTLDVGKMADKLPLLQKDDNKLKASEFETPVRLIAIWSDAVYNQPGQTPTVGFGGRLYFYNAKDKTVPVEGQLVVYAYEEMPDGAPAKTPSRRFGFTPEQFTEHYSATEFGASYSIWIPWEPLGGVRKSITLLPAFTASTGQVVMGEQSLNVLPGKAPENPAPERSDGIPSLESSESPSVRPVSHEEILSRARRSQDRWQQTHMFEPAAQDEQRLRATTIPLPMTMARRLERDAIAPVPGAEREILPQSHNPATSAALQPVAEASGDAATRASGAAVQRGAPPPATRFAHPRSPAPRALAAPPDSVRARTIHHPAAPQFAPPSPRSGHSDSSAEESVSGGSESAGWGQ